VATARTGHGGPFADVARGSADDLSRVALGGQGGQQPWITRWGPAGPPLSLGSHERARSARREPAA
jgi:hypothetical protein